MAAPVCCGCGRDLHTVHAPDCGVWLAREKLPGASEFVKRADLAEHIVAPLGVELEAPPPQARYATVADVAAHAASASAIPAHLAPEAEVRAAIEHAEEIACDVLAPAPSGRKFDAGKRRWDLLPWSAVTAVVDVLTYGATKYAPDGWRHVPNARARYFAAAQRHFVAWYEGERRDPESGLHNLACTACCVLFLLALDGEG